MLIALLTMLGVDLIVIVVVAAGALSGRRCISRNELVAVDGSDEERTAAAGEVKRLGDHPIIVAFNTGATRVEIAASSGQSHQLPAAERPGTTQPEERPRVSTDHP